MCTSYDEKGSVYQTRYATNDMPITKDLHTQVHARHNRNSHFITKRCFGSISYVRVHMLALVISNATTMRLFKHTHTHTQVEPPPIFLHTTIKFIHSTCLNTPFFFLSGCCFFVQQLTNISFYSSSSILSIYIYIYLTLIASV